MQRADSLDNYGSTTTQQQTQNSVFQGLTNKESQAILDDYAKSLTPSEGFFACAATNAAFGLAMNPRIIAHPINTFRATFSADNATNKAFAYVKDANHKLHALWNNPENSNILREAWLQHNKAVARCNYTKLGAFRRSYGAIDKTAKGLIEKEIQALEAALKAGNMQKITYCCFANR